MQNFCRRKCTLALYRAKIIIYKHGTVPFGLCHLLCDARLAGQLNDLPHSGQQYRTFCILEHGWLASFKGSSNDDWQSLHVNGWSVGVVGGSFSPRGSCSFVGSDRLGRILSPKNVHNWSYRYKNNAENLTEDWTPDIFVFGELLTHHSSRTLLLHYDATFSLWARSPQTTYSYSSPEGVTSVRP